jgi:hypothetical protein
MTHRNSGKEEGLDLVFSSERVETPRPQGEGRSAL